jgi:hypothetical protein
MQFTRHKLPSITPLQQHSLLWLKHKLKWTQANIPTKLEQLPLGLKSKAEALGHLSVASLAREEALISLTWWTVAHPCTYLNCVTEREAVMEGIMRAKSRTWMSPTAPKLLNTLMKQTLTFWLNQGYSRLTRTERGLQVPSALGLAAEELSSCLKFTLKIRAQIR